jgi:hypothetical protein
MRVPLLVRHTAQFDTCQARCFASRTFREMPSTYDLDQKKAPTAKPKPKLPYLMLPTRTQETAPCGARQRSYNTPIPATSKR